LSLTRLKKLDVKGAQAGAGRRESSLGCSVC
jgi:hypothetical protein